MVRKWWGRRGRRAPQAGKQAERKKEKTASGSSSKTVVTIGDRVAAERADPWYAEHPGYSGRSGDGSEGTHHSHQRTVFRRGAADDPPISSQEAPSSLLPSSAARSTCRGPRVV
ncbi:unnamed protein product [Microthlaspi erraticum]|uniref:Uncharacterized protein n=1 Tax=Microthlaspi erraticum TaxID=1685480 RepID=A0A6D2HCU4_9BRAS|nr:unnamed protein product [Microthlaspi erraticum]